MKTALLVVLMVTLLFVFGCKEKDENKVDGERVTEFDKMIVDLQGGVKKEIGGLSTLFCTTFIRSYL
mgnify:CR=1 FL=1